MNIKTRCAFTGHRPAHFSFKYNESHPDCIKLKERMKIEIITLIEKGVTTFLSGMALGVDIWGAELVLELKSTHPELRLISVLPCETQAIKWSIEQQERYYHILARCDEEVFVSRQYTSSCMLDRNRYLVRNAAYLLAVYDGGDKGGTAYTVRYGRSMQREIIVIPADGNPKILDFGEVR